MDHFWQYPILVLALFWSVAYLIRRQFPRSLWAVRTWLALRLLATQKPIARRIARALAPPARVSIACAAGSGCGGCAKSVEA